MGQALLGIGAGAAGAFGPAYDAARKNQQQSQLDDFQIQNAQRDAAALSALGALGSGPSALQGVGGGGQPGMQGPPGMPPPQPPMSQPGGAAIPRPGSSIMPQPGSQVLPPGMGQGQPPPGPMRSMGMPIPPTMAAQSPGGPPMPQMSAQAGMPQMSSMAPGGQPQPMMPFPGQQAPSAGLTPAGAPGGVGPPSSSPAPPGGLRGREQLDPAMQGRGGMPQTPQANAIRWDQAMQMVASKNPGIKPDVLMRATDMFMQKFGNPQNVMEWREQQVQFKEQQISSRERMATEAAQMKLQLASLTDERIRDIAQGNGQIKLQLEAKREAARREIVETQQAGATERTGMNIGSREGIAERAQEGAYERTSLQQRGATARTGMQETGKNERLATTEAGKGERLATTEAGKGERLATTEAGKGERQATGIGAKETMQGRALGAAAERQAVGIGAKKELQQTGIEAAGARQKDKQQFTRERDKDLQNFKLKLQERNIEGKGSAAEAAAQRRIQSGAQASPEDTKIVAGGIAQYQSKPMTGRYGIPVMAEVRRQNPGYDETMWNSKNRTVTQFAVGPEGKKLAALQTAYYHLGTIEEVAKNLPGGSFRITNEIRNRMNTASGGAAANTFDGIKSFVASELVKAAAGVGAGSKEERVGLAEKLTAASSKDQLDDIIAAFKDLMRGQYQSLKSQYEVGTGEKDFDRRVGPNAQEITRPPGKGGDDMAARKAKAKAAGYSDEEIDNALKGKK